MLKALALTSQPGQFVLPVGLYSCQGENKLSHTEAPLLYHIPGFCGFAFVSRETLKTILHIQKRKDDGCLCLKLFQLGTITNK